MKITVVGLGYVGTVRDAVEAASRAQALVLLTEWAQTVDADWQVLAWCMLPPRLVFDGRNVLDPGEWTGSASSTWGWGEVRSRREG